MSLVRKESRWVVFIAGMLLLNFPMLNIWNKSVTFLGFPLLFIFLFSMWALLVWFSFALTKKPK